ncbi:MAG: hypothetical protein KatS3mg113_0320 [Planctomycetaceae bacterium]|nr:MAG: hypothetical protein KatS3mg113_0320 [Planctomycetaceae bacterium]
MSSWSSLPPVPGRVRREIELTVGESLQVGSGELIVLDVLGDEVVFKWLSSDDQEDHDELWNHEMDA